MSQETNSVHSADGSNDEAYYNKRQIPFPTRYFGSRQTLAFLLCESCFWCASTSNLSFRNKAELLLSQCLEDLDQIVLKV